MLTNEELDGMAKMMPKGITFAERNALVAQAREANALRARVAELEAELMGRPATGEVLLMRDTIVRLEGCIEGLKTNRKEKCATCGGSGHCPATTSCPDCGGSGEKPEGAEGGAR